MVDTMKITIPARNATEPIRRIGRSSSTVLATIARRLNDYLITVVKQTANFILNIILFAKIQNKLVFQSSFIDVHMVILKL